MRSVRKLRPVDDFEPARTGTVEGHVVTVGTGRIVGFRDEAGRIVDVRVPSQVDRRWLAAAVALAPVPAIAVLAEGMKSPVLWCTFPGPEHESLDDHIKLDAKTIELGASESVTIRTGKALITVSAAGEVQVRGKNILSRATNINRIRGGGVRIN
jgi:hypothetical protein